VRTAPRVHRRSGGGKSEDAAQLEAALAVIEGARESPPDNGKGVARVSQALDTLGRLGAAGHADVAWAIATDERQGVDLHGVAMLTLARLPDTAPPRLRAHALPLLRDKEGSLSLRARAAFALGAERIADDEVRAALEEVLLRPRDEPVVQRSCLDALSKTAALSRMRELLLRPELYRHPYFGIRADVCTGLAALDVRDVRALRILCGLLRGDDPADRQLLVPQEAWLSLWTLTGRTHGVVREGLFAERPARLGDESAMRTQLWEGSFMRRGVTREMVEEVQRLCWRESDGETVRNAQGLEEAAGAYLADIPAIETGWRADGGSAER